MSTVLKDESHMLLASFAQCWVEHNNWNSWSSGYKSVTRLWKSHKTVLI